MIKVGFTEKFDVIVCLDGNLPPEEFFNRFEGIPIYAADGAAIKLMKIFVEFEKVIGDLDTLKINGYKDKIPQSKFVYLPDQESNDFDKTLNYAYQQGNKKVLITGFHGGELEHTLNNWSVLMKYLSKLNLCIYENERYAIPFNKDFALPAKIGETIGLIPQPKAILTTSGFKWNLKNESLELGVREGARNIAMNNEVKVELHSGVLLVFMDARIPFAPNI